MVGVLPGKWFFRDFGEIGRIWIGPKSYLEGGRTAFFWLNPEFRSIFEILVWWSHTNTPMKCFFNCLNVTQNHHFPKIQQKCPNRISRVSRRMKMFEVDWSRFFRRTAPVWSLPKIHSDTPPPIHPNSVQIRGRKVTQK